MFVKAINVLTAEKEIVLLSNNTEGNSWTVKIKTHNGTIFVKDETIRLQVTGKIFTVVSVS